MGLFRSEVYDSQRFRLHGEVMLTRSLSSWLLIALLLGLVATVCVWIVTGHYARTELAVGRIVPDGALIRILPTRPGTIVRLRVHEGDNVKAGQQLATILVAQSSEERSDPTEADLEAIDQQHRLITQQIGLSRQAQSSDAAKLSASISEYRTELASLNEQIGLQQRMVQSAQDSFEPLAAVVERGFVSKSQYEARRQALIQQQEQLAQMKASRAQLNGNLRASQIALVQLPNQTAAKVNDLQTSDASLTERRIAAESSGSYVITAPVSGRVSNLQITRGSNVTPQIPLMTIVGDGARMDAELYAPSRAIGFAKQGQEVRLMYDAFPYQRFGTFKGRITQISRTVLAPNEIDAPIPTKEPVYRLRVALDNQMVKAFGNRVPLQPGMTLTANIVLDRRSFFEWLMQPVRAVREMG